MNDEVQYALRFISGKYQGGEYPLTPNREVIIGRSGDLEVVLVEDMVSRQHAKIVTSPSQVIIQDLGSTNGTFVNGEKIKQARLKEGDRILIGTSIIKLINAKEMGQGDSPTTQQPVIPQVVPRRTLPSSRSSMVGRIENVGLPDLLQLFSAGRKSGCLEVEETSLGRIYLKNGQIHHATIEKFPHFSPHKALYRIVVWNKGRFEFVPPDDKNPFPEDIQESTEGLLMEAMRQMDEIQRLMPELPDFDVPLKLARPLPGPMRDLAPLQQDVVQAILDGYDTVARILDQLALPDLKIVEAFHSLYQRRYILF